MARQAGLSTFSKPFLLISLSMMLVGVNIVHGDDEIMFPIKVASDHVHEALTPFKQVSKHVHEAISPSEQVSDEDSLSHADHSGNLTNVAEPRQTSGICSFYGAEAHGALTANGERFDMNAMTAAHKTLPFNTRIRVTNTKNGKTVDVRINDRGPFTAGRIIDLAQAAFARVEATSAGLCPCSYKII